MSDSFGERRFSIISPVSRGLKFMFARRNRVLYGRPEFASRARLILDRLLWGPLGEYIWRSRRIVGWMRGKEAVELARISYSLPEDAVVVEIGSFLGCSTVLLAGARKLRESGKVQCVDPFDASGDAYSVPVYRRIADSAAASLRESFDENIREAGLEEWVEVHQGRAGDVASAWSLPIDLLFLDADHSYRVVSDTYEKWSRYLKVGGVIAVHNSAPGRYHEDHDGSSRLVAERIHPPQYSEIRCIATTTFARKVMEDDA